MIAMRVVKGVTTHFVLRMHEWIFAGTIIFLGIQLLRPGDTFGSSAGYAVMANFAPEWVWGFGMVGIGLLRVFALIVNGSFDWSRRFSPHARAVCAALSAFAWFVLGLGIFLGNPLATGVPIDCGLMVSDIALAIIISGEAGAADQRYRNARARS